MRNACSQLTYTGWIADRGAVLPHERRIARANTKLYFTWSGIALYRVGAFAEAITSFFRANPSSALLTTRFAADGARHTVSQVGIALGSIASLVEMGITSVLFGRHVHKHRTVGAQLAQNEENGKKFFGHIQGKKEAAYQEKRPLKSADRSIDAGSPPPTVFPLSDDILAEKLSKGVPAIQDSMPELAVSYLKLETAQIDRRDATHTLKHSSVMFARDGILQGGGVGCNLALLWDGLKVSELLQLAAVPINATATAICGFAFSLGCGALHIVAGALRWRDGLKKLTAAGEALKAIEDAKKGLKEAKESQQSELANASRIAESLLAHAQCNEIKAQDDAKNQIRVGKWRISYGAAAMAVGGISLALFLIVGGISTGGILFGIIGGLALAGWTLFAGIRNRNSAKSIEAAIDKSNNSAVASGEGAPEGNDSPTLDDLIDQAVRLLDRAGGSDADARRLIKHTMKRIGLTREDLWPLRFCSSDPAVRGPVVEELKIKIRNLVDGDGARCAAEKKGVARPERKPVPEAKPVAVVV